MTTKGKKIAMSIGIALITFVIVLPFLWMFVLSLRTNSEIMTTPLQLPRALNFDNYRNAFETLNFLQLYINTITICVVAIVIQLAITYCSSFVLARMQFNKRIKDALHFFLILGLAISPFILLFPIFRINVFFGFRGMVGLIFPYVATSISFNTLLLVGYLRMLPSEIDEAALMDGCNIGQLMLRVILPITKPVMATVVIFNVLYIWNEFPLASVMLRDIGDFTLSMGASFFRGRFAVDYGGIIATGIMIIIPQLVFYGFFQRYIVEGMTAGAVKG